MILSSNVNIFCVTGLLWGNHRLPVDSPHKASDTVLWYFFWNAPEQMNGQTIETRLIRVATFPLWRWCNWSHEFPNNHRRYIPHIPHVWRQRWEQEYFNNSFPQRCDANSVSQCFCPEQRIAGRLKLRTRLGMILICDPLMVGADTGNFPHFAPQYQAQPLSALAIGTWPSDKFLYNARKEEIPKLTEYALNLKIHFHFVCKRT